MKKVLYYLFGTILFIIGFVAFIIFAGEPTEEAVHPYLMKAASLAVIYAIIKVSEKLGYLDDKKKESKDSDDEI